MSYTSTARLSRGQTSVGIAGATGNLGAAPSSCLFVLRCKMMILTDHEGFAIASVFLGPQYKPFFSRVVAITRSAQSENAKRLESLGAVLCEVPAGSDREAHKQALNDALKSTDVVIDVLNHEAEELAEDLFEVALAQNACVYIPSEFGV